jgi:hypothetical protein
MADDTRTRVINAQLGEAMLGTEGPAMVLTANGIIVNEYGDVGDDWVYIECVKVPGASDTLRIKTVPGNKSPLNVPWDHEFAGHFDGELEMCNSIGDFGDDCRLIIPTFKYADAFCIYCSVTFDTDANDDGTNLNMTIVDGGTDDPSGQ